MTQLIDKNSFAYAHGFAQGFEGREFRCPCQGNAIGEQNHGIGFVNGTAARERGFPSMEEYEASQAA